MRRFLKKLALKDKVGQQAPWKLERQLVGVAAAEPPKSRTLHRALLSLPFMCTADRSSLAETGCEALAGNWAWRELGLAPPGQQNPNSDCPVHLNADLLPSLALTWLGLGIARQSRCSQ